MQKKDHPPTKCKTREIKSLKELTEKKPDGGELNGLEGDHSTFMNAIISFPQGE